MYLKDIEGKTRQIKRLEKLEEEIKEKYGLYDVIVVDKNLQRHSSKTPMPEKLFEIVKAVFNTNLILDHVSYAKEDGVYVIYIEPYNPVDIQKINPEEAKRFGVQLVPLKRSLHDDGTFPYKIIISNPGDLRKLV